MSIKEIEESMKDGKVFFGVKQCLKYTTGEKGKVKVKKVFVVKDVRPETLEKLEKAKVKFEFLGGKKKEDVAKELDIGFESEVFSLK